MPFSAHVAQGLPLLAASVKAPAGKAGVNEMAAPVGSATEYGDAPTFAKPVTLICGGKFPLDAGWVILLKVKPTGTEIFRTPPAGAIKPKPTPTYARLHAMLEPLADGRSEEH